MRLTTCQDEHFDRAQKGTATANDCGQYKGGGYAELHQLVDVDVIRRALIQFVEQLIDAG